MLELGKYRHFKGNEYVVIGVCKHTETNEDMVVYQSTSDGIMWTRPLKMFTEIVDKPEYNYHGPRFQKIDENATDTSEDPILKDYNDKMERLRTLRDLVILPRRDEECNWMTADPVLRESEWVVSIADNVLGHKLGNGISRYSELPFVPFSKAVILGYIYVPQPCMYTRVKLNLLDKDMFNTIRDKGFEALYDRFGDVLVK